MQEKKEVYLYAAHHRGNCYLLNVSSVSVKKQQSITYLSLKRASAKKSKLINLNMCHTQERPR